MEYLIIFIIVGVIAYSFESSKIKRKNKKAISQKNRLNTEINKVEGYNFSEKLSSEWGIIALDKEKKSIAVKKRFNKLEIYPYSALHSCEILIDGETIYKRSSVLGRSIVGGILAGGTGAIIGGLSGNGKKYKRVSTIDFKILFIDSDRTTFKLEFFDAKTISNGSKKAIEEDNSLFGKDLKIAKRRLQLWKDKIEVIIASQDSKKTTTENKTLGLSPYDELKRFKELIENGILTEKEFQNIKSKLIEKI